LHSMNIWSPLFLVVVAELTLPTVSDSTLTCILSLSTYLFEYKYKYRMRSGLDTVDTVDTVPPITRALARIIGMLLDRICVSGDFIVCNFPSKPSTYANILRIQWRIRSGYVLVRY
jgi:hypothetical protein